MNLEKFLNDSIQSFETVEGGKSRRMIIAVMIEKATIQVSEDDKCGINRHPVFYITNVCHERENGVLMIMLL